MGNGSSHLKNIVPLLCPRPELDLVGDKLLRERPSLESRDYHRELEPWLGSWVTEDRPALPPLRKWTPELTSYRSPTPIAHSEGEEASYVQQKSGLGRLDIATAASETPLSSEYGESSADAIIISPALLGRRRDTPVPSEVDDRITRLLTPSDEVITDKMNSGAHKWSHSQQGSGDTTGAYHDSEMLAETVNCLDLGMELKDERSSLYASCLVSPTLQSGSSKPSPGDTFKQEGASFIPLRRLRPAKPCCSGLLSSSSTDPNLALSTATPLFNPALHARSENHEHDNPPLGRQLTSTSGVAITPPTPRPGGPASTVTPVDPQLLVVPGTAWWVAGAGRGVRDESEGGGEEEDDDAVTNEYDGSEWGDLWDDCILGEVWERKDEQDVPVGSAPGRSRGWSLW